MDEFVVCGQKKLRMGGTTGSCAAAAAKAAVMMLLSAEAVRHVSLDTPKGIRLEWAVHAPVWSEQAASCQIIKDAGDDPDVTDGMSIEAVVSKTDKGITIDGGEGIGRVTKPGLKILPGQAAINPVPLRMIEEAVKQTAGQYGYSGGLHIVISAPEGARIAQRTMNERLGITGGLSILGTSGIVEPMSEQAIVETIRAAIDVQLAQGCARLVVTPGNYGRDFAQTALRLDMDSAVKCSNFLGETLDYAVLAGAGHMTLIGHAGKLVKLAGGIMNTHSRMADARMEILAAHAAMAGAGAQMLKQVMGCVTVDAAISFMQNEAFFAPMWASIGEKIGFHIRERTKGRLQVRYIVFTQEYGVLIDAETNA